jgi:signal transduction histidine kinase
VNELFAASNQKGRIGLHGERSSGLGLMLCKEFVEKHHGTISVESVENKGSTFIIQIPQKPETSIK